MDSFAFKEKEGTKKLFFDAINDFRSIVKNQSQFLLKEENL